MELRPIEDSFDATIRHSPSIDEIARLDRLPIRMLFVSQRNDEANAITWHRPLQHTTPKLVAVETVDFEIADMLSEFSQRKIRSIALKRSERFASSLPTLSRMAPLESLTILGNCDFSHVHDWLCSMRTLRALTLQNVDVDDSFINSLSCSDQLEMLFLKDSGISCSGLTQVFPRVRELDLTNTRVCDECVLSFTRCFPNVKTLFMDGCKLTPTGLAQLVATLNLRTLSTDFPEFCFAELQYWRD